MVFYIKLTVDCNKVISTPGTVVHSENYPKKFPSNMECNYVIRFKEGQRVRLEFLEFRLTSEEDYCVKYVIFYLSFKKKYLNMVTNCVE